MPLMEGITDNLCKSCLDSWHSVSIRFWHFFARKSQVLAYARGKAIEMKEEEKKKLGHAKRHLRFFSCAQLTFQSFHFVLRIHGVVHVIFRSSTLLNICPKQARVSDK
jgi:hypothetical protein